MSNINNKSTILNDDKPPKGITKLSKKMHASEIFHILELEDNLMTNKGKDNNLINLIVGAIKEPAPVANPKDIFNCKQ